MVKKSFVLLSIGTACALVLVGFAVYSQKRLISRDIFFADALRLASINTEVTVGARSYVVEGGLIAGNMLSPRDKDVALRLAYAQALAAHSPLLAIPDSNPNGLDAAADALSEVAFERATEQKTQEAQARIRDDLFPVSFLHQVAKTERDRQAFITSGSLQDEETYSRDLADTIFSYKNNLQQYSTAWQVAMGTSTQWYSYLSGMATPQSTKNALTLMQQGIEQVATHYRARENCIAGIIDDCDQNELMLPHLSQTTIPKNSDARALAYRVASLWQDVAGARTKAPIAEISYAQCTLSPGQPFFYLVRNDAAKGYDSPILETGTLYFFRLNALTDVASTQARDALFEKNNVQFIRASVSEFYACPQASEDVAASEITLEATDLARTHPALAPRAASAVRTHLPMHMEPDAEAFLIEAASTTATQRLSSPDARHIADLTLGLLYASAGIDRIAQSIADLHQQYANQVRADVPSGDIAENLFIAHSGFFALFMGTNPSFGSTTSIFANVASDFNEKHIVTFEKLEKTVPENEIIHDLRFYIAYHQNPTSILR